MCVQIVRNKDDDDDDDNIFKQNVLYNLIMENWTRDPFYLFICSWGELNPI